MCCFTSCHHAAHEEGQGVSRRKVLLGAAGTSLLGGFLARGPVAALRPAARAPAAEERPEVRVAYLRPREDYWLGWPGTAWHPEKFFRESRAEVQKFADELGVKVVFEPAPLYDQKAVDAFVDRVQREKPQGVLLFPLHMNQWNMVDRIIAAKAPTIIFAGLGVCFTGHIQERSRRPGVYLASTSDYSLAPVRYGLKMVRTAHDVRASKVVVIRGGETKDSVLEPFGLNLRYVPRKRFPDTLQKIAETPEVMEMAERYRKAARKIVEPTRADLINAARNYYAALRIMEEEGCDGITMDCLGLVQSREIPTPPCMAWAALLDVGKTATCEADINAVMSHTLCCKLLDKPGFQQDPVPDTVKNTFIGAHCVCATRLNGYDQPPEPFILRSHSESDIGVSLQVIWRPGQEVTIMQFVGPQKMILGRGKVLRNFDTPPAGGCRTSVELEIDGPADTRDTQGFHQLFIYGDHVRDFEAYGQLFGIATAHV
ncbi:MAG: hypothetical protein JXA90_05835 [Planctomycetes bacterium]|nr:hypothetical protein [Planctomycetota bacterium]